MGGACRAAVTVLWRMALLWTALLAVLTLPLLHLQRSRTEAWFVLDASTRSSLAGDSSPPLRVELGGSGGCHVAFVDARRGAGAGDCAAAGVAPSPMLPWWRPDAESVVGGASALKLMANLAEGDSSVELERAVDRVDDVNVLRVLHSPALPVTALADGGGSPVSDTRIGCPNQPLHCAPCFVTLVLEGAAAAGDGDSLWPNITVVSTATTEEGVAAPALVTAAGSLDLGSATLSVEGGHIDVEFAEGLAAGRVSLNTGDGTVRLDGLALHNTQGVDAANTASSIHSTSGDVAVLLNQTARIAYSHPSSMTCISAPEVYVEEEVCRVATHSSGSASHSVSPTSSSESSESTLTTPAGAGNGTIAATIRCEGTLVVCDARNAACDPDAGGDFGALPLLNISTGLQGSMYVTAFGHNPSARSINGTMGERLGHSQLPPLQGPGLSGFRVDAAALSEAALTAAAAGGDSVAAVLQSILGEVPVSQHVSTQPPISFNEASMASFSRAREWVESNPSRDFVVATHLLGAQGSGLSASASFPVPGMGRWLYVNKRSVLEFSPGRLSAFSASVLKPRIRHLKATLQPGWCPYLGPQLSAPAAGVVGQALRVALDAPATATVAFHGVSGHVHEEGGCGFRVPPGDGDPNGYDEHVFVFEDFGGGLFGAVRLSLSSNGTLVAAIAISFVLACVGGCSGALVALKALVLLSASSARWREMKQGYTHLKRLTEQSSYLEGDKSTSRLFKKKERRRATARGGVRGDVDDVEDSDDDEVESNAAGVGTRLMRFLAKLAQLPNPFGVPRLVVSSVMRANADSLAWFVSTAMEPLAQSAADRGDSVRDDESSQPTSSSNCGERIGYCCRWCAPRAPSQVASGSGVSIPLTKFRQVYEQWCFLNGLTAGSVVSRKTLLESYGMHVSTATQPGWIGVRFATAKEADESADSLQLPGESSIAWFLRTKCRTTALSCDTISEIDFSAAYNAWSTLHPGLSAVAVTKREMAGLAVQHGEVTTTSIRSDRLDLPLIDDSTAAEDDSSAAWSLGEAAVQHVLAVFMQVVELFVMPLAVASLAVWAESEYAATSARPVWATLGPWAVASAPWVIWDVHIHSPTVVFIILAAGFVVLGTAELNMFVFDAGKRAAAAGRTGGDTLPEEEIGSSGTTRRPERAFLRRSSAPVGPAADETLGSQRRLSNVSISASVASSTVRSTTSDGAQADDSHHQAPLTAREGPAHRISGCRRALQATLFAYWLLLAGILCAYVTLVATWMLLGAILAPEEYLPAAAGVVTAITFVATRARQLWGTRKQVKKAVVRALTAELRKRLGSTFATVRQSLSASSVLSASGIRALSAAATDGAELVSEHGSIKDAAMSQLEHGAASLFQRTPLGVVAAEVGLDVSEVAALVRGDTSALASLAERYGMNKSIVMAVIANARRDDGAFRDAIEHLAVSRGVNVSQEMAMALVDVARSSRRGAVGRRVALISAFNSVMDHAVSRALRVAGVDMDSASGSTAVRVSAEAVEAAISLLSGERADLTCLIPIATKVHPVLGHIVRAQLVVSDSGALADCQAVDVALDLASGIGVPRNLCDAIRVISRRGSADAAAAFNAGVDALSEAGGAAAEHKEGEVVAEWGGVAQLTTATAARALELFGVRDPGLSAIVLLFAQDKEINYRQMPTAVCDVLARHKLIDSSHAEAATDMLLALQLIAIPTFDDAQAIAEREGIDASVCNAIVGLVGAGDDGDDGSGDAMGEEALLGVFAQAAEHPMGWVAKQMRVDPSVLIGTIEIAKRAVTRPVQTSVGSAIRYMLLKVGAAEDHADTVAELVVLVASSAADDVYHAVAALAPSWCDPGVIDALAAAAQVGRGMLPTSALVPHLPLLGAPTALLRLSSEELDRKSARYIAEKLRERSLAGRGATTAGQRASLLPDWAAQLLDGAVFPATLVREWFADRGLTSDSVHAAVASFAGVALINAANKDAVVGRAASLLGLYAPTLKLLLDVSVLNGSRGGAARDHQEATEELLRHFGVDESRLSGARRFVSEWRLNRRLWQRAASSIGELCRRLDIPAVVGCALARLPASSVVSQLPPLFQQLGVPSDVGASLVALAQQFNVVIAPAALSAARDALASSVPQTAKRVPSTTAATRSGGTDPTATAVGRQVYESALHRTSPGDVAPLARALGLDSEELVAFGRMFAFNDPTATLVVASKFIRVFNELVTQPDLLGSYDELRGHDRTSVTVTCTPINPRLALSVVALAQKDPRGEFSFTADHIDACIPPALLGHDELEAYFRRLQAARRDSSATRKLVSDLVNVDRTPPTPDDAWKTLRHKLKLPRSVVEALVSASRADIPAIMDALVGLVDALPDDLTVPERLLPGLFSIGRGRVQGVEDVAEELGVDGVIAEAMVLLSAGTPDVVRTSQQLPQLLAKLGLDAQTTRALILVNKEDLDSVDTIIDVLHLGIAPPVLRAIMSSLQSSDNVDQIRQSIEPLVALFGGLEMRVDDAVDLICFARGHFFPLVERAQYIHCLPRAAMPAVHALVVLANKKPLTRGLGRTMSSRDEAAVASVLAHALAVNADDNGHIVAVLRAGRAHIDEDVASLAPVERWVEAQCPGVRNPLLLAAQLIDFIREATSEATTGPSERFVRDWQAAAVGEADENDVGAAQITEHAKRWVEDGDGSLQAQFTHAKVHRDAKRLGEHAHSGEGRMTVELVAGLLQAAGGCITSISDAFFAKLGISGASAAQSARVAMACTAGDVEGIAADGYQLLRELFEDNTPVEQLLPPIRFFLMLGARDVSAFEEAGGALGVPQDIEWLRRLVAVQLGGREELAEWSPKLAAALEVEPTVLGAVLTLADSDSTLTDKVSAVNVVGPLIGVDSGVLRGFCLTDCGASLPAVAEQLGAFTDRLGLDTRVVASLMLSVAYDSSVEDTAPSKALLATAVAELIAMVIPRRKETVAQLSRFLSRKRCDFETLDALLGMPFHRSGRGMCEILSEFGQSLSLNRLPDLVEHCRRLPEPGDADAHAAAAEEKALMLACIAVFTGQRPSTFAKYIGLIDHALHERVGTPLGVAPIVASTVCSRDGLDPEMLADSAAQVVGHLAASSAAVGAAAAAAAASAAFGGAIDSTTSAQTADFTRVLCDVYTGEASARESITEDSHKMATFRLLLERAGLGPASSDLVTTCAIVSLFGKPQYMLEEGIDALTGLLGVPPAPCHEVIRLVTRAGAVSTGEGSDAGSPRPGAPSTMEYPWLTRTIVVAMVHAAAGGSLGGALPPMAEVKGHLAEFSHSARGRVVAAALAQGPHVVDSLLRLINGRMGFTDAAKLATAAVAGAATVMTDDEDFVTAELCAAAALSALTNALTYADAAALGSGGDMSASATSPRATDDEGTAAALDVLRAVLPPQAFAVTTQVRDIAVPLLQTLHDLAANRRAVTADNLRECVDSLLGVMLPLTSSTSAGVTPADGVVANSRRQTLGDYLEGVLAMGLGKDLTPLARAFGIPVDVASGLTALANGDLVGAAPLARNLGPFDVERVQQLVKLIKRVIPLAGESDESVPQDAGSTPAASRSAPEAATAVGEVGGVASAADQVFAVADTDNSGLLDVAEFGHALKYLGISISEHAALELVARVGDGTGMLDREEFKTAVERLRDGVAVDALTAMGLSRNTLLRAFAFAVAVLLFMLVFVFCGVAAFATGGAFGAVVNSVIPLAVGLGVSAGSDTGASIEKWLSELPRHVKAAFERIGSS